jgi:hypothetical protein
LDVFPKRTFAAKIQVEGLIVRAIAKVMPQVPMTTEVKRGGKKERHDDPGDVIDGSFRVKNVVLSLVTERVTRIHNEAVDCGEDGNGPPTLNVPGCPKQQTAKRNHQYCEANIQASRDGEIPRLHVEAPGL